MSARFLRASALAALGVSELAWSEHAIVLAARREVLGAQHPDTLASERVLVRTGI
jgi:hypothetical protein